MVLPGIFGRTAVGQEEFGQWAREADGVDAVHHYHALRACLPHLTAGRQKMLDIGPEPGPWLRTVERFAGSRHELWACRQGGEAELRSPVPKGAKILPAEFDVWSPLSNREAPTALGAKGFTLVTALQVVDRLYHPDTFFRVVAGAMAPRGILVLTCSNVARFGNVLGLLRGGGVAGDLDALIGRRGKYPRPRVREYCWQELTAVALGFGLAPIGHGFYDDPADASPPTEFDAKLRETVTPLLRDRGQLQSEMVLIFRKAGTMKVRMFRLRRSIYMGLREAHAKYNALRRRLRARPAIDAGNHPA
jgi:hypothetical protein